jgi:outer membrane beta-barrel protein
MRSHPALFMLSPTQSIPQRGNSNNFDLIEKVSAGYLMNTLELGRVTLIAGVRFEGTQDNTLSFDTTVGTLSFKGNGSYVDVLPSAASRSVSTVAPTSGCPMPEDSPVRTRRF